MTFRGELLAIQTAETAGAKMRTTETIEARSGTGLAGDRYAEQKGKFQRGGPKSKQQITLIEAEAIESANADYGVSVTHASTRRNLLTRGVPLNHLVGKTFHVGEVTLLGVELCEPCTYLEQCSGTGHLAALKHRGGLRAKITTSGTLRVGDPIT